MTATNTLTRYGFLGSRRESRSGVRSARSRRRSGETGKLGYTEPAMTRRRSWIQRVSAAQRVSSPVPVRLTAALWRLNLISRKGQSKLMGRDRPPPPPPSSLLPPPPSSPLLTPPHLPSAAAPSLMERRCVHYRTRRPKLRSARWPSEHLLDHKKNHKTKQLLCRFYTSFS